MHEWRGEGTVAARVLCFPYPPFLFNLLSASLLHLQPLLLLVTEPSILHRIGEANQSAGACILHMEAGLTDLRRGLGRRRVAAKGVGLGRCQLGSPRGTAVISSTPTQMP